MNAAQRRHYDAIQQTARDEWSSELRTRAPREAASGGNERCLQDADRAAYDRTLARIREEKPDTFAALKTILDYFMPPNAGDAFFPRGADDELADALADAGWEVRFFSSSNVYSARQPVTRAKLHHLDGDLYDRTRIRPEGSRLADPVTNITVGHRRLPSFEETNR